MGMEEEMGWAWMHCAVPLRVLPLEGWIRSALPISEVSSRAAPGARRERLMETEGAAFPQTTARQMKGLVIRSQL